MATLSTLFEKFSSRFPQKICPQDIFRGETTWVVTVDILLDLMRALKEEDGFNYLVDVSSVDDFGQEPRFQIVYELCRLADMTHLRIKTAVKSDSAIVPSVSQLWRTADWHEREVYDMMGIRFDGHPDLRRILMWEGYPFYPLRKDFPLAGKPTEMPDIAFTKPAPLEGGPFITSPAHLTLEREPRARPAEVVENQS